ncbi:transglutaminase-like domain-containing protein [Croceicoccus naphthovorans]|uniref:Transglutaminase n=1 Tax=Croceicoccus naphthovorans TaxID=1348774 RepID=A0A0G3XDA3_9SPHN|nr:transglutaminase family protein [Croceicoccus naphthovorans]AKM09162.1 transglutaminase [Croceicoccus naphthovorans]MBB3990474.1 transglutaminase-like putative cysteine protease [Croceicoccus naphthovorans]
MPISVTARIAYRFAKPTDFLLQMEGAAIPEQILSGPGLTMSATEHCARVAGEDAIGERIWLRTQGDFTAEYAIEADITRTLPDIASLPNLAPHDLPGETVPYLFDSRFCPGDRFQSFVEAEFGDTTGGGRIAAIRDWVAGKFSYEPGSSVATTTALDSFVERRGVCRDYAHVVITLARASAIPARYVSGYAPNVDPQDFHALAEVFLADLDGPAGTGSWHLVDATGMADPAEVVKIGVGRDAAEVSFLTSYGMAEMLDKQITVQAT